jgi:hypothetical protein
LLQERRVPSKRYYMFTGTPFGKNLAGDLFSNVSELNVD